MPIRIRVYYEDTDCGGVVYYANYLKYFERGRTECLRELGVSLSAIHAKGVVFAVTRAEVEYIGPCRYDDLLVLDTRISGRTGATLTFEHSIKREGTDRELVRATVTLASIGTNGSPVRMPSELKAMLPTLGR